MVYKAALEVEIITMGISIFASIFFGYLYEVWSRKKVLTLLTILLAGGMVLPALDLTDEKSTIMIWSRVITGVIANAIMQNPLLMDYVKKHNRGMASSLQFLGKELGEFMAFYIIYEGLHYNKEN